MSEDRLASTGAGSEDLDAEIEDLGHPRGTLAIVILYGVIFALAWLGLYLFEFLPRGAPTP